MSSKKTSSCKVLFKELPSIDALYQILDIDSIAYPRDLIKNQLRKILNSIRKDIKLNKISSNIKEETISRAKSSIALLTSFKLNQLINGTGIVLHTGLGRSPLSKDLVSESFDRIYPYSNLEFDVNKNSRGDRNDSIQDIINPLIGSQKAIVVNNCAAALLLTLNTLSEHGEVIISRGQQIEIGGSFRIPEVIKKSGSIIRDVGTTNKTHAVDYQNAINSKSALILYAHTSNYRVVGFTNEIKISELSKISRKNKIPLIVDAGSGCFASFERFNMPLERITKDYFKKGADIVMFSGDKLLGGPQSGIIAGKKKYIDLIKKNPLYRALRVDKLTFSLLEGILRTYKTDYSFYSNNLALELLTRNRISLEFFGNQILNKISSKLIKKYNIRLIETMVEAGSGAMPINSIESIGIIFNSNKISPNKLSQRFRSASIPVIGYIKDGNYIIDLKAIPLDFEDNISKIISEVLL